MKPEKRSDRRARTRRVLKKRVTTGKVTNPCGISDKEVEQPHRFAKRNVKFTGKGGSLKEQKQEAARAARRKAREAVRRGDDPPPESPNSVRWECW